MKMSRAAAISGAMHQRLTESCRLRSPAETCGIIIGRYEADTRTIAAVDYAIIRNASSDPTTSFDFDPTEWVRAWYEAMRTSQSVVGVFHSHPDGSTVPSKADTAGRLSWGSYWIVGLSSADSRITVYLPIRSSQWQQLPLFVRT